VSLAATATSDDEIYLEWSSDGANTTGYLIERSPDSATWAQIVQVPYNQTTYLDSGLTADTLYYYRVRATNNGVNSGYSNIASATTLTSIVFMGTPVLDDFDRMNNPVGANWTTITNAMEVVSNQCSANAIAGGYWNPGEFTADQEAYLTFAGWNAANNGVIHAYIAMRRDSGTGLGLLFSLTPLAGGLVRFCCSTNSFCVEVEAVPGDVFGAVVIGDAIYMQQNGVLIGTTSDDTYLDAGNIGIVMNGLGYTTLLDDFGGGDYA
jgi:hypothetical protein